MINPIKSATKDLQVPASNCSCHPDIEALRILYNNFHDAYGIGPSEVNADLSALRSFIVSEQMMHLQKSRECHSSIPENISDPKVKPFPKDFNFNAASSAYQIEGGWNENGKGESICDTFYHSKNARGNADVACDSYHRFLEDVRLLKFLGASQYKFSISWSRILPNGFNNTIIQEGIQYYKNLIRALKDNNIEPLVVMYHNDLPQWLQNFGGFTNATLVDWFADYSRLLFKTFGEDVKNWITFNEGYIFCFIGHGIGKLPPGIIGAGIEEYKCGHNLLKAHAKVWHIYDKEFRPQQKGKISMAFAIDWFYPATNKEEDIAAAERNMEFMLGWMANPLYNGDYPAIMKERIAYRSKLEGYNQSRLPEFTEEEKEYIKGTLDFFSLQTYNAYKVVNVVESDPKSASSFANDLKTNGSTIENPEDGSSLIGKLIQWINDHYNHPTILITENGLVSRNTTLEDQDRISHIKSYLTTIRQSMENGSTIIGYTVWSLTDCFDWIDAYSRQYGLFYVDFSSPNRTRIPRKSAYFFKELIKNRTW